jgi:predicted AAA+ superfamily ATPase
MAKFEYKQRIADLLLASKLRSAGAVLVQGPKWCGKSTTASQIAESSLMLGTPKVLHETRNLLSIEPSLVMNGATPRLFDEWQTIPELWDTIRSEIDNRQEMGQFVLTGSAVPLESNEIQHTGTGRFAWLRMRPMTLWESQESTGDVSLAEIFDGVTRKIMGTNKHSLQDIAYILCRGGWPISLSQQLEDALNTAYNYVDAIAESDLSRVDNTLRNPMRVRRLLRSLGRLQGTAAPISTICQDMIANDESTLSEKTIASYINALEKIFVIEDMPAWSTNLRSKTAIRTSNTRYFVDPSIAVAALGITPSKLMNDLNTFGLLFETMAVRDLRVYADAINAKVYHYRDKDELECDAIIERRDGSYGLVEIKIGGDYAIREAQNTLNTLSKKIDTDKVGKPQFRMILTAVGDYAMQLEDGCIVVPIGCLKP